MSVIQDSSPADILATVRASFAQAGGRCIVSAGCEVPPGTSLDNFRAFAAAAAALSSGA